MLHRKPSIVLDAQAEGIPSSLYPGGIAPEMPAISAFSLPTLTIDEVVPVLSRIAVSPLSFHPRHVVTRSEIARRSWHEPHARWELHA